MGLNPPFFGDQDGDEYEDWYVPEEQPEIRTRTGCRQEVHRGFEGSKDVLGRLDLRIGRVIHVEDDVADPNKFYFEYIDAGDRITNGFVRGLNKHFLSRDFCGRRVVLLYIALPGWINCQESRLLGVLYAYKEDKVELLLPPIKSDAGELIQVKGHIHSPPHNKPTLPFYEDDYKLLKLARSDFWVNGKGVATYKGVPLEIKGRGHIITETLTDCPIT